VNGVPIGEVSLTAGCVIPNIWVDEPIEKRDFPKVPPLSPTFMNGAAHNVNAAIKELRAAVKGFFVEMPLKWGVREKATLKAPFNDPAVIANIDVPGRRETDV
jgi:phospholipase D1/2